MRQDRRQKRDGRLGYVFSLRLTEEQRLEIERLRLSGGGPRSTGAWLVWRALHGGAVAVLPVQDRYYPGSQGSTGAPVLPPAIAPVVPGSGSTATSDRVILDLCSGSGSWSRPYAAAGYRVITVTLPGADVRTWTPPKGQIWGVLAAPPCTQFSLARNGHPEIARDFVAGMEIVNACMRVILQVRPKWWALENPTGLLSRFLGTPRDTWQPCDFGDPWTKRTAIWGDYAIPKRGPYVAPLGGGPYCSVCDPTLRSSPRCSDPDHVAITAPGFSRAFFEANP